MCHVSHIYFFLQSGGASWWRVCYQRGLPRLAYKQLAKQKIVGTSYRRQFSLNWALGRFSLEVALSSCVFLPP